MQIHQNNHKKVYNKTKIFPKHKIKQFNRLMEINNK